jgi:hypothetical protein
MEEGSGQGSGGTGHVVQSPMSAYIDPALDACNRELIAIARKCACRSGGGTDSEIKHELSIRIRRIGLLEGLNSSSVTSEEVRIDRMCCRDLLLALGEDPGKYVESYETKNNKQRVVQCATLSRKGRMMPSTFNNVPGIINGAFGPLLLLLASTNECRFAAEQSAVGGGSALAHSFWDVMRCLVVPEMLSSVSSEKKTRLKNIRPFAHLLTELASLKPQPYVKNEKGFVDCFDSILKVMEAGHDDATFLLGFTNLLANAGIFDDVVITGKKQRKVVHLDPLRSYSVLGQRVEEIFAEPFDIDEEVPPEVVDKLLKSAEEKYGCTFENHRESIRKSLMPSIKNDIFGIVGQLDHMSQCGVVEEITNGTWDSVAPAYVQALMRTKIVQLTQFYFRNCFTYDRELRDFVRGAAVCEAEILIPASACVDQSIAQQQANAGFRYRIRGACLLCLDKNARDGDRDTPMGFSVAVRTQGTWYLVSENKEPLKLVLRQNDPIIQTCATHILYELVSAEEAEFEATQDLECSAPQEEDEVASFAKGAVVVVVGLENSPEFNGLRAIVLGPPVRGGRIPIKIKLETGVQKKLAIYAINLSTSSELLAPCSVCGNPAKKRCQRCDTTPFCSKKCVKAAWPYPHKDICRTLREKNQKKD